MVMLITTRNKIASSPLLRHLRIFENVVLHEVWVQVIRKFLISGCIRIAVLAAFHLGYQAQPPNQFCFTLSLNLVSVVSFILFLKVTVLIDFNQL